ncbi:MAG: hypothetical protein K0S54_3254 [Alphaproteobacteria bacterium]|jgi:uncharacterized membrane protein|nr:hypothetical protein [Alphaproteobacteria bacterium]
MSMRTALLAVLLTLIGGTAQAQLTLCNRVTTTIDVAYAEENKGTLQVVGWKQIAPNACVRIALNRDHDYAYYAYTPDDDMEWVGDEEGVEFCVHMNRRFRIDYDGIEEDFSDADDFRCPAGSETRLFMVIENDGRRHSIDLD